jgi:hypothetical protein
LKKKKKRGNGEIMNVGPVKIPRRKKSKLYPVIDGSINQKLSGSPSGDSVASETSKK